MNEPRERPFARRRRAVASLRPGRPSRSRLRSGLHIEGTPASDGRLRPRLPVGRERGRRSLVRSG